ncbi:MAG: sugar phosphate isomerase/epimerase [Pirellulales bacterium]|nr:sugar phosphate isomerase/epimerase [Pirellulales bacterium]
MVPTLFSVSYAGLWGQHKLELDSFIRKAADLGYEAVELMGKRPHLGTIDIDEGRLKHIRDTAVEAGVEISTIAGYTNFTLAQGTEIPAVEFQLLYVRELASMARQLGAKNIRIFSGYSTDLESYSTDWKICVDAVRKCARVAEEYGIVIGVQNHHDVGVGVDSYVEFLDEVDHPNCRAMFDAWAPALHGDDLQSCARRLAPRMIQTTVADYVRLPRYAYMPGLVNYKRLDDMVRAVPMGEGFIDYKSFFAGLREGGFDGYVAYEMCSPLRGGGSEANLDRSAKISLETIRSLIGT